jgi:hypothetical protein
MLKRFEYAYERYYGELEDYFEGDLYAEHIREAVLLLFAMLKNFYAATKCEAIAKAESLLNQELGKDWTVEDLLGPDFQIWPDNSMAYRIHSIAESLQT